MYSAWRETRHMFGRDCIIVWGALLLAVVFSELWLRDPSGFIFRDLNTFVCWFVIGFVALVCLALLIQEYLPIDPRRYGRMALAPLEEGGGWVHVFDLEDKQYPFPYALRLSDGTVWSYTPGRHQKIYGGPMIPYWTAGSVQLLSTYRPTHHLLYDPTVSGRWKFEPRPPPRGEE